jgi:hypothetical protein
MGAATTVKVFIDIFIGIWAFILAWIWASKIEARPGEKVGAGVIWERFPKFVIGYVITFLGTELEFVIMVIAVSCVKLLSAHNSTQHTSRKHKV